MRVSRWHKVTNIVQWIACMGGDHGGTSHPQNFERGTLMQIVPPPRFCHIGTKMNVLWSSKYAEIRFRPGLCPRPRWGSSRCFPRPLSRLEKGHPSPHPTPLGTNPPSALAMRPPRSPARYTPMIAWQSIGIFKCCTHIHMHVLLDCCGQSSFTTLWPWPLMLWPWTYVFDRPWRDQKTLYQILAKLNNLPLSWWPNKLNFRGAFSGGNWSGLVLRGVRTVPNLVGT